ncbi:thioredoxin-dependent thiol peroxidase [Actinotignum sp. GS-2025d]|uniref:thioredoxin-dependent thiol peroxidase n=1 Tax=Actinotignum sp. GS-2025d TaxID=3427277 RepID=UPI003F44E538
MLNSGDRAPDFTLESTAGTFRLSEHLNDGARGVIVYFYPKANTPGCTTEACDFRDNLNSLRSAGYAVVGVSPDSLTSLQKFREKQGLNFVLASDPDHAVASEWGAWGEKQNWGKTVIGMRRSTVVVNPDGTVAAAFYNVKATGHVARLRRDLGIDE